MCRHVQVGEGGAERRFAVRYNYDDEAQISLSICHASEQARLQAVNRAPAEGRARRGEEEDDDDEAQIPLTICHVFHVFDHFDYMLSAGGREAGRERPTDTAHARESASDTCCTE